MVAASRDPVVRARDVTKWFGHPPRRVDALRGVSVEVRAGELLAVTGPSGSGKTTLLHCLSGIIRPDAGTVMVGDVDIVDASDHDRAAQRRDHMAFVFQQDNLLPALNVLENVQLPLVIRGLARSEIVARSLAALEAVGLADRGDAPPADLSGGEAQRVAIARALASDPRVLWADEPTGSLDRAAAIDVVDRFRLVADRGAAVVLVTHDPEVAARADRRVALVDGVLAS